MANHYWRSVIDDWGQPAQAVVVGPYGVFLGWHGFNGYTEGTYDVMHMGEGVRIATYSDLDVACNFAEDLLRTYGDIADVIRASRHTELENCDEETQHILKAIDARKRHPSRLIGGILKPANDPV